MQYIYWELNKIFPLLQNFDQFTLAQLVNSFYRESTLFIDSKLLLLVSAVMVVLVVLVFVVVV